eukprot:UN33971
MSGDMSGGAKIEMTNKAIMEIVIPTDKLYLRSPTDEATSELHHEEVLEKGWKESQHAEIDSAGENYEEKKLIDDKDGLEPSEWGCWYHFSNYCVILSSGARNFSFSDCFIICVDLLNHLSDILLCILWFTAEQYVFGYLCWYHSDKCFGISL